MSKHFVVSNKNMPTRPPTWSSCVAWLMLDRLQHPGWVAGVVWTIMAVLWIGWLVSLGQEKAREIWPEVKG